MCLLTTFGSRLSTCYRVLQKERLLTYGVDSPGQSRGISPLQGGNGGGEGWVGGGGGGGGILGEVKARPKDIISFSLDYISKSKVQTSNPSSSPHFTRHARQGRRILGKYVVSFFFPPRKQNMNKTCMWNAHMLETCTGPETSVVQHQPGKAMFQDPHTGKKAKLPRRGFWSIAFWRQNELVW